MEVAEPVPAVAAIVDPVIAEATGLAPRADRVGVHAKDARRLLDGERRGPRSGRDPRGVGGGVGFGRHIRLADTVPLFTGVANRTKYSSREIQRAPDPVVRNGAT